jgi:hypothetical protein
VHGIAQPPQLAGSSCVSTQTSPHFVVPPRQSTAHAPCEQTRLASQALPQAPQFAGSFCKSAHLSAQVAWPAPHVELPPVGAPPVDDVELELDAELPPAPPLDEQPWRAVPPRSERVAERTSHCRWFMESRFIAIGS